MSVQADVCLDTLIYPRDLRFDPEWQEIVQGIEALDHYLKIQNLRRSEEEHLVRLLEGRGIV